MLWLVNTHLNNFFKSRHYLEIKPLFSGLQVDLHLQKKVVARELAWFIGTYSFLLKEKISSQAASIWLRYTFIQENITSEGKGESTYMVVTSKLPNTCWTLQSAERKSNKCHMYDASVSSEMEQSHLPSVFLLICLLMFHKHNAQEELWISALMNRWRIRALHSPAALLISLSYSSLLTGFDLYWPTGTFNAALVSSFRCSFWFQNLTGNKHPWFIHTPNTLSSPLNSIQVFRGGKDRSYLRQERIIRNIAALQAAALFPGISGATFPYPLRGSELGHRLDQQSCWGRCRLL